MAEVPNICKRLVVPEYNLKVGEVNFFSKGTVMIFSVNEDWFMLHTACLKLKQLCFAAVKIIVLGGVDDVIDLERALYFDQ